MNAEFDIRVEFTAEFETDGVALTVFFGEDSDGDVYTFNYDDMVTDLIDLCTYDDNGSMDQGDRDYLRSVYTALMETAEKIKAVLDEEPTA